MGLSDTDMVLAAAPVAANHRIMFLTSGATSPELPAQVPKYLFLAGFGDNVQAAAAAEFAYQDLSARTVAVLFNASMSYTRLLHRYFQTRFTQLGGRAVSVESYRPDRIGQAVARLRKADFVFLAAGPEDALAAVQLLRKAGITTPILGGDGFDSDDVWRRHPELGNVYFTTHAYLGADSPDPKIQAFRTAYSAAYPGSDADAFAALGYDTAGLLMAAIERAGNTNPRDVRKALAAIKRFKGLTGTISYRTDERIPTKSVSVLRIENGRRKFVREVLPTSVPSP